MQNNIENNINTNEKKEYIQNFINAIKQKLEKQTILVIDRFEGNFAVCENRENNKIINIPIVKLPEQAKEGDVIKFKNNKYELDIEKRQEIEEEINNKLKNLFND